MGIPAMTGPAARDAGNAVFRHWSYQLTAASGHSVRLRPHLQRRRFRITAHPQHLADAVLAVAKGSVSVLGEAFHVAMREAVSCEEYLNACSDALGLPRLEVEYCQHPEAWAGGPLFSREVARNWGEVSLEKALRFLG